MDDLNLQILVNKADIYLNMKNVTTIPGLSLQKHVIKVVGGFGKKS